MHPKLLLLLLLFTYTVSATTLYQVQIRNRGLSSLNYKSYSTTGRWDSPPATRILPLTFSNAISTGTWSHVKYKQGAYVSWGDRGCSCDGCGCSVSQKSETSWVVDFKC
ncbi:hypothetical protein P9112_004599 [Eukaryota sp. TZLM1-RC]